MLGQLPQQLPMLLSGGLNYMMSLCLRIPSILPSSLNRQFLVLQLLSRAGHYDPCNTHSSIHWEVSCSSASTHVPSFLAAMELTLMEVLQISICLKDRKSTRLNS